MYHEMIDEKYNEPGNVSYTTIGKWGNSQAIRIPKDFLDALGLMEYEKVALSIENGMLIIRKSNQYKNLKERLECFYNRPLDEIPRIQDQEVDWGKPEGNEVW